MSTRGRFIVIEGLDGAGTTTQTRLLAAALTARGRRVVTTGEPTRGPLGAVIRQVIEKRFTLDPRALALAFAADRLDHYHNPVNGIGPAIEAGCDVISDRYALSSLAYQGLTCDRQWLLTINGHAPAPDFMFFLHVPPAEAWRRVNARSAAEDELFHVPESLQRIAAMYDEALRCDHPLCRAHAIDGMDDEATVCGGMMAILDGA